VPIFEKPPLESLTPAKDRWTPIYLEHGRLEVDDSSIKWLGADRLVYRLPVATLSAVLLGPGTTVTHAAMKACADSNTPVCWIGEDGLRFYAVGITPNHDNAMPRKHAAVWADKKKRTEIAHRMFGPSMPNLASSMV
jgi:CRISPR-associated protein Cas1